MMNKYVIYMHRNLINGKIYIGQTCMELNRCFKGGCGYQSSPHFYRAIQEYGWENFSHTILEENLTSEQADEREKYYIKLFDSTNPNFGYNIRSGGKVPPNNKEGKNTNKKSVICKETGKKFSSLVEAATWAGMKKTSTSNITAQIRGQKPSAGKHPVTGEQLHWCWEEKDINTENRKKIKPGAKKVKNLDTGEIFNSVNEAASVYKVTNITISKSCKSNGIIAVGGYSGPKYRWIFLN